MLKEFYRILAPRGYCALTGYLGDFDGMSRSGGQLFYYRCFKAGELESRMRQAGFDVVNIKIREPQYDGEFDSRRIYVIGRKQEKGTT